MVLLLTYGKEKRRGRVLGVEGVQGDVRLHQKCRGSDGKYSEGPTPVRLPPLVTSRPVLPPRTRYEG